MTEHWNWWLPLGPLQDNYDVLRLLQKYDSLELLLNSSDNTKQIQILFSKSVVAYRTMNETYRGQLVDSLEDNKDNLPWLGYPNFLQSMNSLYLVEIKAAYCKANSNELTHYLFSDDNYIIDVVVYAEPLVRFVTEQSWPRVTRYAKKPNL